MPSSSFSPSSSSSSSSADSSYKADSDASGGELTGPEAERFTSYLRTKDEVDAICKKYGVPKEFTALPAGDMHSCSPPPPGAVCVYEHALAAGMRLPLHPFFCEVLRHFGLAPSQLAPNGWRIMVGFVVLCLNGGVPPSLPVFLHFFTVAKLKFKGWYCFRRKETAGVLFKGLSHSITRWKESFFFLSSPAPWPCPVRWGEPPSPVEMVPTSEEKKLVAKLLDAHDFPVDLRKYLSEKNLAAAFSSHLAAASPPAPRSTTGAKGIEPSVYEMMESMRAEKAAAEASATGKKRKLEEANAKEGSSRSQLTRPAALGSSVSCPSTSPTATQKPPIAASDRHDGDAEDWVAARHLLQGIVTPTRERALPAANPSDVVAASYVTMLQAANYASFSFGYALELEEKLRARERDAAAEAGALRAELGKAKAELARAGAQEAELQKAKAELARAGALRSELQKAKGELAAAKNAAASEAKSARASALQDYLGSSEHKTQLAEHALVGYERGLEDMKRVALRRYPHIDPAMLVVPPGGHS